ncbi:hypothetical protein NPX13_g1780 [Xylaria arbuscula]|uniref:NACHT domain-containing protein n=1 Tax=Xylaria arbuscula TaxID=114810 RepID=A0A9W8NKG9_9PEZI|nr:hypothetical protein NPX13_g1780 [Xylaria arbuscula]
MKSTLAIIAFAAAISAQTWADIPACAQPCILEAAASTTDCADTDYACICASQDVVEPAAEECVPLLHFAALPRTSAANIYPAVSSLLEAYQTAGTENSYKMSFGFGVGDFLAVIGLINKVRKDFVKAADQFPQICHDLRRLENAARDIEILLSERQLSLDQQRRLGELTQECNIVLEDAKKLIDQYSTLKSSANGIREKASRFRGRFSWDPVDANNIQARINGILVSCNLVVEVLNEENLNKLVKEQERQEDREQAREHRTQKRDQQEVLDWLTSLNYAAQQSDFINQCEAGTGQWLLDSAEYRNWLSTKQQALFCPGIPGAGKTMLASIVVDNLLHLHRDDENIGICYIFLNFRRVAEQTVANLVASLIKQLESIKNGLSEPLRLLYEKHKKRGTRPSCKELCDTLQSLSANYSRIFMIVDALDEFQPQDNGFRSRFIDELLDLWSNFGVNIFVTSRFIPEITCRFDKVGNKIEIRASNDDIAKYMDGKLSCLPAVISRHPEFWTEIKREVVRCVDGMFLLARLHCDALRGQCTRKAVRAILTKLSRDSGAGSSKDNDAVLQSAYQDALLRVKDKPQNQVDLAMQTLMWITFAKRPLNSEELRHALGVELDSREFDVDNLPDLEDMVSYCCGLVAIDEESQIVRLVHYTTQEYLVSAGSSLFPSANSEIAQTCITYLNYDVFLSGACFEEGRWEFDARLKRYPLYGYASRYGPVHTSSTADYQFCHKFLSCVSKVEACREASLYQDTSPYRTVKGFTGLHFAAIHGLHKALPVLRRFYDTDTADQFGTTPILYAIMRGHIPMVEALLAGGVSANSIVEQKTLLMHVVLRETGNTGQAQTSDEAESIIKILVQLLLNFDADINARVEGDGGTAIAYAAQQGLESIVQFLLKRGAEINIRDASHGHSEIFQAVRKGHESIVRLLLENGANANLRDKLGRTPLFFVAEKDKFSRNDRISEPAETIAQYLMERGNEVDSRGYQNMAALHLSASTGNIAGCRFFLKKGADIESHDIFGRTPLSYAAAAEYGRDTVKFLVEKGADIHSRDIEGRTPLSYAASAEHRADTVKFLVELGADIDSKDSSGQTPLIYAIVRNKLEGYKETVQLLLERRANPEVRDNTYRTPLQYAQRSGNAAIVELLRQKSTPMELRSAEWRKNEAEEWILRCREALLEKK